MYCKKCEMRFLSRDDNLCFFCAGGKRYKNCSYWEWHNDRYDKDEKPGIHKIRYKGREMISCFGFDLCRISWPEMDRNELCNTGIKL